MKTSIEDWSRFVKDKLDLECTSECIAELIEQMETENDFNWKCDRTEWRVIDSDEIDDIAEEEIKEIVQDSYLNGTDLDKYWWIEIDWKKTAENCIDADGYGHHFASYDGNEYEHNDWYFFRIN